MTIEEAVKTAMDFEKSSYQLYTALAAMLQPDLSELASELAKQELKHYELLEQVLLSDDLGQHREESMAMVPSAELFGDYVRLPELGTAEGEDDILAYAEARERTAFEQYGYLAEVTPPGRLRDLFAFLRDEEAKHLQHVETRWSRTYSSP
jgi:rubrerythrin